MSRLLPAAGAVVVTVSMLAGCTTAAQHRQATNTPSAAVDSPQRSTTPAPAPGSADRAALRAATVLFAAHPAAEASFNATWLAHRDLLTFTLTEQLLAAGTTGSNATWQLWQQHGATLTVTARPIADDTPPDSAQRAVRHLQVTLTPHGTQHWTSAPTQLGVVLTLQAEHGRWLVGGIHVDV